MRVVVRLKTGTIASLTLGTLMLAAPLGTLQAQHDHAGHRAPPSDSGRLMAASDAAMAEGGSMSDAARLHMQLTRERTATRDDSVRAFEMTATVRQALTKYADTAAAVADGYRMFMPNVRQQRVYHFTNYRHAFLAAFRFDPARPTSILYRRRADGGFELIGAMYTAPRGASEDRLDERIPLSIGRWHLHVNWCVPARGESDRWLERRGDRPVFGPESPIATKAGCELAGGRFLPNVFGWMIHANVFLADDLGTVFGHGH